MPVLHVIIVVLVVGVLMWAVHKWGAPYIHPPFLMLADAVAIIATVIWLLHVFGVLNYLGTIRV